MLSASWDWLFWGVTIMIALPIAVIGLGELAEGLERSGHAHFRGPVDALRKSFLFLLFATILLRQVAGFSGTDIVVKVVDTATWITLINAVLVAFNAFAFQPGASDWRSRAPKLLIDLARVFLVAAGGALVVSQVWDVDLGGLLAALGVGSLVIGLALQETLGNVFSGVAMISARQFGVGDWIRIGEVEGQVRTITWRTVSVTTLTGDVVVIPNSAFGRDRLRLLGADRGHMRIPLDFKFAYDHPPETVIDLLVATALRTTEVMPSPPPVARLVAYEDGGILYRVSVTVSGVKAGGVVRSEFAINLWYAAERAGMVFPGRHSTAVTVPAELGARRRRSAEEIAAELGRLGTFRLPAEALRPLVAAARTVLFRRGEDLVARDMRSRVAYVVLDGNAEAVSGPAGTATQVDVFAPGALILFKEFLRGRGAPFTVRAITDVEAIELPLADLEAALAGDLALARQVEELLSARSRARQAGPAGLPSRVEVDADRVEVLRQLFG